MKKEQLEKGEIINKGIDTLQKIIADPVYDDTRIREIKFQKIRFNVEYLSNDADNSYRQKSEEELPHPTAPEHLNESENETIENLTIAFKMSIRSIYQKALKRLEKEFKEI